MTKTGKKISLGIAIVLIVAAAALWWVYGRLGQIVENAVESNGPAITGTEVALDGATLSLFSGEGALRGLTIGNPAAFSDAAAFELGRIETAIDVGSLTGEVVRVRSVVIDGPRLLAEFDAAGLSNLKAILDHARATARGGKPKEPGSSPPKKVIIEEFRFTNAEVRVLAPAFKVDKTVKLGPIHLRNLGEKQGGAGAAEIGRQMLQPVVDAAVRAATREYLGEKRDELREKAGEKLLDKLFD